MLWCVVNCLVSSQLSRIYSLWHGCHGPLTPDPSPPGGARGGLGGRWSVIEYEYRPPGRTEYEYECAQSLGGWAHAKPRRVSGLTADR